MTESPTPSPWPAPVPADLVSAEERLLDPQAASQAEKASPAHTRHAVATLLSSARRFGSRTERAEHAAAKEEQRISDELDYLPAGWFVLHSPDIASDDDARPVDHVAIGPGGVFMVYVEHQAGAKVWISEHKVTINGRDSDHLRQARFEAAAARAVG